MLVARRYDPVAVDLFGVQNPHATCGSPSRFPVHTLKLVILELKSKPATENEAEPLMPSQINVNSGLETADFSPFTSPRQRQSRVVCGLKKVKAKRMKIAELRMTSDQRP